MPRPDLLLLAGAVLAIGGATHLARAGEAPAAVYASICAVCHDADGAGAMPGVPDLTVPSGRLAKPDDVLVRSIVDGVETPGAQVAMPPSGLEASDARALLSYLRHLVSQNSN